jgi:hypothetical protein
MVYKNKRRLTQRKRREPMYRQQQPSKGWNDFKPVIAYLLLRNQGIESDVRIGMWGWTKNEKMFIGAMVNLIENLGEFVPREDSIANAYKNQVEKENRNDR